MTTRIEQVVEMPRGDAKVLPFEITEADTGEIVELTNADIEWELHDRSSGELLLSLDDSGVAVQNRDDPNGRFEIKLATGSTDNLSTGAYREYVRITDTSGNRTTWIGSVRLIESQ